jgi:serine/threonine protein kinase/WD40 repeat protein
MPDNSLLLGQLVEEFTARMRAGQMPDLEEYARQHPELAERIRALFPTLLLLEGMAAGKPGAEGREATTGAPAVDGAVLAPGQTFNHYRIERELGRGGMGVVYEAVHLPLGKRVALKVLPVFAAQGPSQLERFLREAQTAAALHHTNIVPVFDIGQAAGLPYYAMQLIAGRGLDQILRQIQADQPEATPSAAAPAPTGPYTPGEGEEVHAVAQPGAGPVPELVTAARSHSAEFYQQVAELGIQAAEGLAFAHQRGVIHRDIKPSNLLLDDAGVLWITDFGLARRAEDPALTHSGVLVGTPRYMSPEQAEAARRPVDHRTDLYSLGATLYELVARRPAFCGKTPAEVVVQILEREPVAPRRLDPAVPRDLETIILKAMAKRPDDRYPTAAALADDLHRFLDGKPIRARPISMAEKGYRWCRRNPVVAGLLGALVVVLCGGFAAVTWQWLRAEAQRDRADAAHQQTQAHLARSLVEQARTVLGSRQPGRRDRALQLIREAQQLCNDLNALAAPTEESSPLPSLAELCSVAVAALLTHDVRLLYQDRGAYPPVVGPGGRFAVLVRRHIEEGDQLGEHPLSYQLVNIEAATTGGQWQEPFWHHWTSRLALSPDGARLARAAWGKKTKGVELYALGESQPELQLPWPAAPPMDVSAPEEAHSITRLAFSPNGRALAAMGETDQGSEIVLWDLTAPKQVRRLAQTGVKDAIFSFSPSGKCLAYQTGPKEVAVLVLGQEDAVRRVSLPLEISGPLAVSWQAQLLACVCGHGPNEAPTVLLWNLAANHEFLRLKGTGPLDKAALAFHPQGTLLAVADADGLMTFFQSASGLSVFRLEEVMWESLDFLCWSLDGRRLTAGNDSFGIRSWDLVDARAHSAIATGTDRPHQVAFSSDNRWVAYADTENQVVGLIDRSTGQLRRRLGVRTENKDWSLLFSPDSRRLALLASPQCYLWDVDTGKEVDAPKRGSTNIVFSPGGNLLFLVEGDNPRVWDLTADRLAFEVAESTDGLGLSLSPDGRFLIGSPNGLARSQDRITVWELTTGRVQARWNWPDTDRGWIPQMVILSPDVQRLATLEVSGILGTAEGEIPQLRLRLWKASSGEGQIIPTPPFPVSVCFHPDGRWLAVGCNDGTVMLAEADQGREIFRWKAGAHPAFNLTFTPDGARLASCDDRAPVISLLDLTTLKRELADLGLGW